MLRCSSAVLTEVLEVYFIWRASPPVFHVGHGHLQPLQIEPNLCGMHVRGATGWLA